MSTIRDVAREAGVSTATVSRVFNNAAMVDEETRRRVRLAVRKMNYVPHPLGRGLSTRRTETVGMLLPDLLGEFFSEVIRGADEAAQRSGYHLLVSSSHNSREDFERTIRTMHGRVDALLIMSPDIDAETLFAHLSVNHPIVLMNCRADRASYKSLTIDNYGGAVQVVRHILRHGHRRIAFLAGRRGNLDAEERLRGYCEAMKRSGTSVQEDLIFPGEFSENSGYDAARKILTCIPRPTAIIASNDSMALGVLGALREAGVRVPQEMALTGFDDIPLAAHLSPALTTVHLGIRELGVRAMEIALDLLQRRGVHLHQREVLSTSLRVRESCGCTSVSVSPRGGRAGATGEAA
jgi:LacI family transcriptional regulator